VGLCSILISFSLFGLLRFFLLIYQLPLLLSIAVDIAGIFSLLFLGSVLLLRLFAFRLRPQFLRIPVACINGSAVCLFLPLSLLLCRWVGVVSTALHI